MNELGCLLQSQNRETRARAITIFHARFLADPSQIINNFPDFLPYYRSLLLNRREESVAYYEETEHLVRCINSGQVKFTEESGEAVLSYFLDCFLASPQNCRIDAFAAHILDESHIVQAILAIFKQLPVANHLGILFRLVTASESEALVEMLKGSSKDVASLIIADPPSFLDAIVSGLQSSNKSVCEFTIAAVVVALSSKHLLLLLVPYTSYIQALAVQKRSGPMQQVYQMLHTYLMKENVAPNPTPKENVPLAMIRLEGERFLAEGDDTGKRRPPTILRMTEPMSLLRMVLEEPITKFVDSQDESQPQSPQPKQPVQRSMTMVNKKEQAQEVLSTFAHKLGGFQHGAWQQRQFQFFPNNKCLLWRSKKAMSEIKGLILLESNVGIEKLPKGLKGKQFVIQIKLPKKTHEIAFSSQEEVDKWMDALLNCTNQGK